MYDKFVIASTILDVSFNGASCSIPEKQAVNECDGCNLNFLCKKVDRVIEE